MAADDLLLSSMWCFLALVRSLERFPSPSSFPVMVILCLCLLSTFSCLFCFYCFITPSVDLVAHLFGRSLVSGWRDHRNLWKDWKAMDCFMNISDADHIILEQLIRWAGAQKQLYHPSFSPATLLFFFYCFARISSLSKREHSYQLSCFFQSHEDKSIFLGQ